MVRTSSVPRLWLGIYIAHPFPGVLTHGKPGLSSHRNPFIWRSHPRRIVLNYKRIPYKTVWLSYPDIEKTLIKLGCAPTGTKPNDPTRPHYTLPAIVDASSSPSVTIADSLAIAEYLDAKYPDRPVFPKTSKALEYAFEEYFKSVLMSHIPMLFVLPSCVILDDRGSEYFRQTRELAFGKKLEEFGPEGEVREGHWKALEAGSNQIAAIIEKNGPDIDYVAGGSEPTRADLILVSFLMWIKTIVPEEWEKRVKGWSGGRWERLLKKTKEWQAVV